MNFDDLTPEKKEKVLACKTPEELLSLAREEGYNLTEEQLEGITGGWGSCDSYDPGPCQTDGCVTNYWC